MSNISALKETLSLKLPKLNRLSDNGAINTLVENIIQEITYTEFASIWIYNFPLLTRIREDATHEISMKKKTGLLYECFAKKETVIYNYLSSEKGYVPEIDNPDNVKIRSKIMIPLIDNNNNFIGIATASSTTDNNKKFSHNDVDLVQAITPFIIEAIHKMKQNNDRMLSTPPNNLSYTLKRESDITHDLHENLDELEESLLNIKAPGEILEYVSNIVHDIRTPANGLVGFLEILQEQIEDSRLKEYIGHAKNSALLINELTTSILDGVTEKREPISKEPITINTVKFFSDIAEIFSANMSKKNIHYNIFIDPLLPKEIKLNSMKTKRVIINLIGNATKFTPEGGSIEFSVRYKQKEKKLHIFIKDSGIGIAKEKQTEIFKAFKQAEENTKDIYGGTGLGLSICAKYIQDMGSKLLLESKINHGSTFYFDLPMDIKEYSHQFEPIKNSKTTIALLMDKHNSVVANNIIRYLVKIGINVDNITLIEHPSQITQNVTHLICFESKLDDTLLLSLKQKDIKSLVVEENFLSLNKQMLHDSILISQYTFFGDSLYSFVTQNNIPRVLIVEDDNVSIILMQVILENEYCEIDIARNGEEGLELLTKALKNSKPYNIVYTDHNMPLLSGAQMLQEYKKSEVQYSLKRTLTVSISGDTKDSTEYDYDYCATKPFKRNEIVSLFLNTTQNKE